MTLSRDRILFLEALRRFIQSGKDGYAEGDRSGESVTVDYDTLAAVWRLSYIHAVLPMAYDAAAVLSRGITDPDAERLMSVWKQQAIRSVAAQTIRSSALLQLCKKFDAAGLHVLVVKGIICRRLYPKPDYRTSADEDIYVLEEELGDVRAILEKEGLTPVDPDEFTDDETDVATYVSRATGLKIELHRHLFEREFAVCIGADGLFEHAHERALATELDGVPVLSMCRTDHMIFLLLHACKHFVHSGFGIRQVCDICRFAEAMNDEIDWQEVRRALERCRAETFAASLFRIGSEYLGFPDADYIGTECPDVAELLDDILDGGVYGSVSEDRIHSGLITLNAVSSPERGRGSHILRTVFPPARELRGSYRYLRTKPWLLPAAWVQRIFSYLGKGKRVSAEESLRIGKRRVGLLRRYGLVQAEEADGQTDPCDPDSL